MKTQNNNQINTDTDRAIADVMSILSETDCAINDVMSILCE
jgi:hypothetical protein